MRTRRTSDRRRRGSNLVETAVILPVSIMLTLGTCIIGLGIYRYQQVASLAREGARFASVHGSQYYSYAVAAEAAAVAAGNKAYTVTNYAPSDIYTAAIAPMAIGLNPSNLTYTVQWGNYNSALKTPSWVWNSDTDGNGKLNNTGFLSSTALPTSYNPKSTPPGEPIYNAVKVTVSYQWTPELYITGPINLTSTSVMPMSF